MQVVNVLMSNGADLNISGSVGDRPLHLACAKGHLKVTQLLVEGNKRQKADGNYLPWFSMLFLCWCFMALRHILSHFGCGQLT